jgi:hypothetical protein
VLLHPFQELVATTQRLYLLRAIWNTLLAGAIQLPPACEAEHQWVQNVNAALTVHHLLQVWALRVRAVLQHQQVCHLCGVPPAAEQPAPAVHPAAHAAADQPNFFPDRCVQQQQGPQTQAPRALSTWQQSCSCILLPLSYMQSVVLLLVCCFGNIRSSRECSV